MDRIVEVYSSLNFKELGEKLLGDRKKATAILAGTVFFIYVSYKYKKWRKHARFFKDQNIPGPAPLPVFGNFLDVITQGMIQHDLDLMTKYGKICGAFEGAVPVLMTSDVAFIKSVMIKDFNHFVNRRTFDSFSVKPVDKFLTVIKDEEWKNVRSIVMKVFTSGKLKLMSKNIVDVANNLNAFFDELVEKDGILDTRKYFGSFTMDVISSCFFGIDTDSIRKPDNEYIENIKAIFSGSVRNPKLLLVFFAPKIASYLSNKGLLEIFPMAPMRFLEEIVFKIIELRKSKQQV